MLCRGGPPAPTRPMAHLLRWLPSVIFVLGVWAAPVQVSAASIASVWDQTRAGSPEQLPASATATAAVREAAGHAALPSHKRELGDGSWHKSHPGVEDKLVVQQKTLQEGGGAAPATAPAAPTRPAAAPSAPKSGSAPAPISAPATKQRTTTPLPATPRVRGCAGFDLMNTEVQQNSFNVRIQVPNFVYLGIVEMTFPSPEAKRRVQINQQRLIGARIASSRASTLRFQLNTHPVMSNEISFSGTGQLNMGQAAFVCAQCSKGETGLPGRGSRARPALERLLHRSPDCSPARVQREATSVKPLR